MESLYLLIPVALIFCALVIKLLLWAIDNGQYDDLDKESWRILADEDMDEGRGNDKQKDRQTSNKGSGNSDDQ